MASDPDTANAALDECVAEALRLDANGDTAEGAWLLLGGVSLANSCVEKWMREGAVGHSEIRDIAYRGKGLKKMHDELHAKCGGAEPSIDYRQAE